MKCHLSFFVLCLTGAMVSPLPAREPVATISRIQSSPGDSKLYWAFRNHLSEFQVRCSGTVTRKLPDDIDGSRHQKFIVTLDSGQTLLVAHNIDLAPRVTHLRLDDRVKLSGEYIWSEQGGIIHFTHHDSAGITAGGWIKHRGKTYR